MRLSIYSNYHTPAICRKPVLYQCFPCLSSEQAFLQPGRCGRIFQLDFLLLYIYKPRICPFRDSPHTTYILTGNPLPTLRLSRLSTTAMHRFGIIWIQACIPKRWREKGEKGHQSVYNLNGDGEEGKS